MPDTPNIQIDDNWKQQAQREKESLSGTQPTTPPAPTQPAAAKPKPRQMPPASLQLIVEMFAMQAMLGLGTIPDPHSGKTSKDLDMSRHFIDLLAVIKDKTKGNLDKQEESLIDSALCQLRMQHVNAAKQKS